MKVCKLIILFFFILTPLCAAPFNFQGNDTLIGKEQDPNDLMKYLSGTWNVKGTWQVLEGKGKVKYSSRATISGKATYKTILNGHFLEKNLQAKVSYYSRDFGKKISSSFSSLTLYTYNDDQGSFYAWYYDSSGSALESEGPYDKYNNEYTFSTDSVDDQGEKVKSMHVIHIVDKNTYTWEVRHKTEQDYEWKVTASGTSKRS